MMQAPEVTKHESGLRTQALTGPVSSTWQTHTVALPPCCPVSDNPREGSTLEVRYRSCGEVLEVYSLRQVVERFRGGWRGTDRYPAERNMEGMIGTLAQMCADALGRYVRVHASVVLDAGRETVTIRARPRP